MMSESWSANGFPIWLSTYRTRLRERGVSALRVVAMTYNAVWDYRNGIVPDTPPGLTVEIVSGGGQSSFVEDMDGEVFRARSASVSDGSKDVGALQVRDAAHAIAPNGCATLVLLYAGVSRLSAMCDVARTIHERGADVALVGCGCDLAEFMRAAHALERDGVTVDAFWGSAGTAENPCHGGRDLLRDMVRAAIAGWTAP